MDLPPLPSASVVEESFGIDHDPVAVYNKKRARLLDSMLSSKSTAFAISGADALSRKARFHRIRRQRPVWRTRLLSPAAHRALKNYCRRYFKVCRERCTPLRIRRREAISLTFESEYDIQALNLVHWSGSQTAPDLT